MRDRTYASASFIIPRLVNRAMSVDGSLNFLRISCMVDTAEVEL